MNLQVLNDLIKYLLEGLAVSIAAYYIPRKNINIREVLVIGVTAALTFMLLDMFAPGVGVGTRQGSGFGIGWSSVSGGGRPQQNVGHRTPSVGQRGIIDPAFKRGIIDPAFKRGIIDPLFKSGIIDPAKLSIMPMNS